MSSKGNRLLPDEDVENHCLFPLCLEFEEVLCWSVLRRQGHALHFLKQNAFWFFLASFNTLLYIYMGFLLHQQISLISNLHL